MKKPYTQLYVHCVRATWDRLPLLTPEIEQAVYAAILEKCGELKCPAVAIGGMPDHVHLLVQESTTVSVAELVQQVKEASLHLVTHRLAPAEFFKWQGCYGAFTVSKETVPGVKTYIESQKEHHAAGSVQLMWESVEAEA